MRCWLCNNPAGWMGYSGDPDDPRTREIPVCGLHSNNGDRRIE